MKINPEYNLSKSVATFMKYKYPRVLYHFDSTGLNLSMIQATMLKQIQHSRGWCDFFIAEMRGGYGGLFLELKADGEKIFKKDGTYKTEHLREQAEVIDKLNQLGYCASFAIGIDECMDKITNYLKTV